MSKTNEELNALKKEVESVNEKLHELTPEELEQVTGGVTIERQSKIEQGLQSKTMRVPPEECFFNN